MDNILYTSGLSAFGDKGGILGLIIFILLLMLFLERYITSHRQLKQVQAILEAIKTLHIDLYRYGGLDRRRETLPVEVDKRKRE